MSEKKYLSPHLSIYLSLIIIDMLPTLMLKLNLFIFPSQRTSLHNKDIGGYENITCSSIIMEGWTLKHRCCNPINRTSAHPPINVLQFACYI